MRWLTVAAGQARQRVGPGEVGPGRDKITAPESRRVLHQTSATPPAIDTVASTTKIAETTFQLAITYHHDSDQSPYRMPQSEPPSQSPTMATDAASQPPPADSQPTADSAAAPAQDATVSATTPSIAPDPASAPVQEPQEPPTQPAPVPGPRASRLQAVYADRLGRTLAKLSYPNVAACYPTVAARAPNVLRAVQAQMVSLLDSRGRREFDAVVDQRDVVRRLNELEGLVAEAERRRGEAGMDGRGEVPVPYVYHFFLLLFL